MFFKLKATLNSKKTESLFFSACGIFFFSFFKSQKYTSGKGLRHVNALKSISCITAEIKLPFWKKNSHNWKRCMCIFLFKYSPEKFADVTEIAKNI